MVVLALVLFAIVLGVAAWAVRPSTSAAAVAAAPGHSRLVLPRMDRILEQLRGAGDRFRSRSNDPQHGTDGAQNRHDGSGDHPKGLRQLTVAPIALPAPRVGVRTTDRRFEGFDLRSVQVFAIRFWACVMGAMLFGTAVLWFLASLVGIVSAVERFMRGIGFAGFSFLSVQFLFGVCLLAFAFGTLMVVVTMLAAALYNVLANRYGGIRMFTSEDSGSGVAIPAAHQDGDGEVPLRRASSNGNGPVMARVPARVKQGGRG